MSPEKKTRLIDAAVQVIRDNADRLTELDRAIGDGDHGLNLKRLLNSAMTWPVCPGRKRCRRRAWHLS